MKTLYRNNLKNREFDKEAPQNSCPARVAIAERQGPSEDENSEGKKTQSKTDSSGYFGILFGLLLLLSAPLYAARFYPSDWIRQNLELAKFFVHFGEPEEKIRTLQEILEFGSQTGNLKYIRWVFHNQQETQVPIPPIDILKAWERIVLGGFDRALVRMPNFSHILYIDERIQEHLVDLALEVGYPDTVAILQNLGFSISVEQQLALDELKQALDREVDVIPPLPLNELHHNAHGGDANREIYHKEYRTAVAFALYRMQNKPCDFKNLIEQLGHRRRHMAVLGKLDGIKLYGIPTDCPTFTRYNPGYTLYGQRIREKYPDVPFIVSAFLNGRKIFLTQINEDSWFHPDGEHREEILVKINALCQKVHAAYYPEEKTCALAYDLGKIIWWLSHAPPFLRGTPTIIAILMDAFWICHQRKPFKSIDLNCEATHLR